MPLTFLALARFSFKAAACVASAPVLIHSFGSRTRAEVCTIAEAAAADLRWIRVLASCYEDVDAGAAQGTDESKGKGWNVGLGG